MVVTPSWGSTTGTVPSHFYRQENFKSWCYTCCGLLTQGHLYTPHWSLQSSSPAILISESSEMSSMACREHMADSIAQSALAGIGPNSQSKGLHITFSLFWGLICTVPLACPFQFSFLPCCSPSSFPSTADFGVTQIPPLLRGLTVH